MKTLVFVVVVPVLASVFLGGCANTFQGAGRDIENAGQAIQRSF